METIYLDMCGFSRPYDDQTQTRIRLETQAKLELQADAKARSCHLHWSAVLDYECGRNPYPDNQLAIARHTIWHYQQRLGIDGVTALFQAVDGQLLRHGYPSAQRNEMLKALGYRGHIQCKAKAGQPLSECQKGRNKRIAKPRARVEHPFAQMRHMGGKLVRTIGQARATVAMTMMAAGYNFKRLAKFLDDRVDAFYKINPSMTEVRLQGVNA